MQSYPAGYGNRLLGVAYDFYLESHSNNLQSTGKVSKMNVAQISVVDCVDVSLTWPINCRPCCNLLIS